jgi:hypothetical protein
MGKNILTKELLLKSVLEWNAVRKANPDVIPDLSDADISGANINSANLCNANLIRANLTESNCNGVYFNGSNCTGANFTNTSLIEARLINANFHDADLFGADLKDADLRDADFHGATLCGANLIFSKLNGANLYDADLRDADLFGADLSGANLCEVELFGAVLIDATLINVNLNGATVGYTAFGAVDLSSVLGLDTLRHAAPSTIGIDTIYASHGNIPEVFLRGCGVPENFIENIRALTMNPIDFYSCFISYSTKDDDFARRIHNDLQASGVRCWFAPHDIQGGKKVLHQIEEAIRVYDKLLLILSPDSMNSNWVEQEIINAIQKEKQQQKQVLFPISIVPFEQIKKWKRFDSDSGRDLAREIREYHIPDFSRWGSDQAAYKTAFERLLKDLKQ